MREREIIRLELESLKQEIRKLAENEKSSAHFSKKFDAEKLTEEDVNNYVDYKNILLEIPFSEYLLALENLSNSIKGVGIKDSSSSELGSWLKNRITVIKSYVSEVAGGTMTIEECEKELEFFKNELKG